MTKKPHEMTEAERLEYVTAHPHYDAVRAKNPGREPSVLELAEHGATEAHASKTKAQRIAHELDALIAELRHQSKHNVPVSPGHIQRLEAIRAELG